MNYLKMLQEKRNKLSEDMQKLVNTAKVENRALSDEESAKFETMDKDYKGILASIAAEERARDLELNVHTDEHRANLTKEEAEVRAFANYIKGTIEERTDVNLTTSDNGAVIPASIVNKIIKKVIDISPLYQLSTRYNVGGTMSIPYYDEATQAITMAYSDEFSELESTSGKFTSIQLGGFLAGALTKVSKSLLNNSNFALVDFIVNAMSETIARFIEKELINGTSSKVTGLSGITSGQTVTGASTTAVTADELIDVQEAVADMYQAGAVWIMKKSTRTAIRKLKDGEGNYLLNRDMSAKWGYTLLGKDVYVSDNMPAMASDKRSIFYGDFTGLAVTVAENPSIEVLREKFATQHAIGVVAWLEMDSKIENAQKIACLKNKA
jgi:HK97 family phage major capsid protein